MKKILVALCCALLTGNVAADSGEVLAAGAIGLVSGAALGAAAASHSRGRRTMHVHHCHPQETIVVHREPVVYRASSYTTIRQLEREIDGLAARNSNLLADNDNLLATLDELKASIRSLQKGQEKLERRIAALLDENEALAQDLTHARTRNKQLQEEVDALARQNKRLAKQESVIVK